MAVEDHTDEGQRGRRRLDGMASFCGFRWEAPERIRMEVQEQHLNLTGLLSGAVTYAIVDYCMGSTLWAETTEDEHIATVSISINSVETAAVGQTIVCTTALDRRNDRVAVLRGEVRVREPGDEDGTATGRLVATAVGSYSIFPPRGRTSRTRR